MDAIPQRFRAQAVIETIREQGRTVTWLAKRLGVSRQYTNNVVHGYVTVGEPMATRIAQLLDDAPFFLLWKLHDRNEKLVWAKVEQEEAA